MRIVIILIHETNANRLPKPSLRASLRKRFQPAAMGMASLSLFGAEGGALAQTGTQEPTLPEARVQGGAETSATMPGGAPRRECESFAL
jgi:hypothetical protein